VTERLILRQWCDEDYAPFAELNADPRVRQFFPSTLTREESNREADRCRNEFDRCGYTFFATQDRSNHEFLGFIGLLPLLTSVPGIPEGSVEIGWRLKSSVWNRGLATEGARASLKHAFDIVHLDAVFAYTTVRNLPSRRVMENAGLIYQPHLDFDHPKIPEASPLRKHVVYRILSDEAAPHLALL
jgi:RimJ/RimL family protein N-acetyltransferase